MSSNIPFDPRDGRLRANAWHHAAMQYIEKHAAQYLDDDRLLESCAAELMAVHGMTDSHQAHHFAVMALAEVHARARPAWIDISQSTSYLVRVVDPITKRVFAFTASELVASADLSGCQQCPVAEDGSKPRPRRLN